MHSTAMLLATLTGALLAIQIGCNAAVGTRLGHPLWGSLANFAVGSALLVAVTLLLGLRWPAAGALASVPAWAWIGGLFGAAYIVSSTVIGPLVGGAAFLAPLLGTGSARGIALVFVIASLVACSRCRLRRMSGMSRPVLSSLQIARCSDA